MESVQFNKSEDSNDSCSFPIVATATTLSSNSSFSSLTSSERGSAKVFLNVYDLNPINLILSPVGVGLFHSGIEINGTEYSFTSKGMGIFRIEPKKAKGVRFREQIEIGTVDDVDDDVEELVERALDALRQNFKGSDYCLVTNNCNHFCDAFMQQLLGKRLPGHINRMSKIWVTARLQWLVPKKLRQCAPTGDKNMKAYQGLIPFLSSVIDISSLVVKEWIDSSHSVVDIVSTTKGLSLLLEDGITSTGIDVMHMEDLREFEASYK